jgi:Fe-S cluster assembly protein SufD
MLDTIEETRMYAEQFEQNEKRWSRGPAAWLAPIRKAAIARFLALGLPTTRHEQWRYTNVAPLAETTFRPAERSNAVTIEQLRPHLFGNDEVHRLVFVNGFFTPELSDVGSVPKGVTVGSLADLLVQDHAALRDNLARHADHFDNAFAALNTALMEDGVFVHVPAGTLVEQPLHVLFVTTDADEPTVTYPRTLVVAETGSQLTLVESHLGLGGNRYFTNGVSEFVLAENARVDYHKVQRESCAAFHIHTWHAQQQRDSSVTAHSFALGGRLTRNDVRVCLDGAGAHATLNGLSLLANTQHVDDHLRVEHLAPHCDSREYYKNILDGESRAVFTGRIYVEKDAQKTDGKQTNMNLLLSDEARVDTKPQLEIFADDVKCTHGATIGQIDADALFYLRSRGIPADAARALMVHAFAGENIDKVGIDSLREQLWNDVFKRLPRGPDWRERG